MALTPVTILSDSSGYLVHPNTGAFGAVLALNGVTAVGPSAPVDLLTGGSKFLISTTVTGAPTAVEVAVEGLAPDGLTWRPIVTTSAVTGEYRTAGVGTGSFRAIRANVLVLSGGSTPTVTATIAALPAV